MVFAVIAVALVKIAFFDGLDVAADTEFPTAEVAASVVPVAMGTVANTIELSGTVAADTGVQVRSSAEGEVVHLFAAQGDVVEEGEALFQVRRPADIQPEPEPVPVEDVEDGEEALAPVAPAPLDIVYEYYDVLAPAPEPSPRSRLSWVGRCRSGKPPAP